MPSISAMAVLLWFEEIHKHPHFDDREIGDVREALTGHASLTEMVERLAVEYIAWLTEIVCT